MDKHYITVEVEAETRLEAVDKILRATVDGTGLRFGVAEPGVSVNAEWILEEVDVDFLEASDEEVAAIHSLPLSVVRGVLERHLGYDSSMELLDDFRREVIRDLIDVVNDERD